MLFFLKERRLRKLCGKIECYVSRVYDPPKPERRTVPQDAAEQTVSVPVSDRRYSISEAVPDSDRYDAMAVRTAFQSGDIFGGTFCSKTLLQEIENNRNLSFSEMLVRLIERKRLKPAAVYSAAQVDRKLYSKIVSKPRYKPSKDTCIALLFALRLELEDVNDMLSRAGYVLSHSSKRDIILEYCFRAHIYNLNDINEILYRLDEKTL